MRLARFVIFVLFLHLPLISALALSDGLILHYKLDNSTLDLSKSANHGSLHGADFMMNRFHVPNSALILTNQGAFFESGEPLPDSSSVTVSLWLALVTWANLYDPLMPQVLFFEGDDSPGRDLACFIAGGFYFTTKDNSSLRFDDWLPPTGAWIHLVCVADAENGMMEIYVDGEKRRSGSFTSNANVGFHSRFNLGRRPGAFNDWFFSGGIDEVRVYNRALTFHEVQALFRSEVGVLKRIEVQIASVRLKFAVEPGHSYIVQTSSDLKSWRDFVPFIASQAVYDVEVPVEGGETFFRLLEQ